ncbi:MAG: YigZ family protein [Chloroflexota bacterium]
MPTNRYQIPSHTHRVEEEIKRSRFITTIAHTPTVEDARNFIAQMNVEFADASHNCWAYVVGPPGSTAQIGMSDAGEPHGTAGKPMLTVLLHSGVGDICAVVTRYFGGTLLGKGGLVKAYSGGVQLALKSMSIMERVPSAELLIVIDYATVTPFQRMLPEYEAELLSEEFGVDATMKVKVPLEQKEPFIYTITDMTNGNALVEVEHEDE